MLSDAEELAANLTALRTFAIYSNAALVSALTQRGGVLEKQALDLNRTLASAFRQAASTTTAGAVAARAHALAAEMLDEIEKTVLNMATIPPGAGRA